MLGKIVWKNSIHKPLNTALCLCLLIFGVSIISLLIVIKHQLEQRFEENLKNIDVVIGAKGSPLQLVLSAVYHLDSPTGNIDYDEVKKITENQMVKKAIPLSYGDSHKGFRILGTTKDYITNYDAQLKKGKVFSKSMEVTIGANVAKTTGLDFGSRFEGTHGEMEEGFLHENQHYTVVGVLKKSNTVLDNLILTNLESVWSVHDDHHKSDVHEEENELNQLHDSSEDNDHHEEDLKITAVLIKYKSKIMALTMPRYINEQTKMQAVLPGLEINRLFYLIGVGISTLQFIAGCIIFLAGFSIFFVLFSRLQDRQYELALMRTLGYKPRDLFFMLLTEGFFLTFFGYIFGWIFSRIGLFIINIQAKQDYNIQFYNNWIVEEIWLLLITILLGVISSLFPAWKAMKMDVSKILSKK